MSSLRVVLDTNVLLSALLFHAGALFWLRNAWQTGDIHPLSSRETMAELIRVLSYPKFDLTGEEQEDLLADYLPWCETVVVSKPPAIPRCRDTFDRPFLELALVAQADALITGDNYLLDLAQVFPVPILTPRGFRDTCLLPDDRVSRSENPGR